MNVCVGFFWRYQQVKTGETNQDMDTECLAEAMAKPVAKRLETDRGGDSTTKNWKLTNITNNILMETLMYLMATWWQMILWTRPCNRTCSAWAAHGSEFDLAFIYIYIYIYIYISWPCHFWLKFREADWQVPIKSKSCCVMRIHLQHFMACQRDYSISHFSSQPPSGFPLMTFSNFQVHSALDNGRPSHGRAQPSSPDQSFAGAACVDH